MKELQIREEAKKNEEKYYKYGMMFSKEELTRSIKLHRRSGLDTVKHRFNCFYKRKGLKRAYRDSFVKNILDRIYLFFL